MENTVEFRLVSFRDSVGFASSFRFGYSAACASVEVCSRRLRLVGLIESFRILSSSAAAFDFGFCGPSNTNRDGSISASLLGFCLASAYVSGLKGMAMLAVSSSSRFAVWLLDGGVVFGEFACSSFCLKSLSSAWFGRDFVRQGFCVRRFRLRRVDGMFGRGSALACFGRDGSEVSSAKVRRWLVSESYKVSSSELLEWSCCLLEFLLKTGLS